jgi:signal transduction histidine kinase
MRHENVSRGPETAGETVGDKEAHTPESVPAEVGAAAQIGLAHRLRGPVAAALASFGRLQSVAVPCSVDAGVVLGRSLREIRDLVSREFESARIELTSEGQRRASLAAVIGAVEAEASADAAAGGFGLEVRAVEGGVEVGADAQALVAAIARLIENAFKFSRTHGRVSLRTTSTADRILIDVEDECGGLAPRRAEELLRPFEQRSSRRTGRERGLAASRRGVEAMGGSIRVRDVPSRGCVFTIDLPRLSGVDGEYPEVCLRGVHLRVSGGAQLR